MSKIENGTYTATIKKAFVATIGQNNNQAFVIEFHITDLDKTINWNGWMTEKGYERTLQSLATMGFDESLPTVIIDGLPSYTANHFSEKTFELVIENEPDIKDPTKMWPRVKWVNLPNQSKFKNPPIKGALHADFKAQMAAARAKLGIKKSQMKTATEESFPF